MSTHGRTSNTPVQPSSNWLALKKKLDATKDEVSRKRRKTRSSSPAPDLYHTASIPVSQPQPTADEPGSDIKTGESVPSLRKMTLGLAEYTEQQKQPGRYLALDCEMVGVGIDGSESSLARVSLVNYYGAIQLDEYVHQRERVVDYRTQYSGIRAKDMAKAKPFNEVQQHVAELLKGCILIGHAVHNDLKALLLSHPHSQTRDTQLYAWRFKLTRSKYAALRNLVKQELDLTIQSGEHSSVTDARATMALYRLHRKTWEKGNRHDKPNESISKKRKRSMSAPSDTDMKDREQVSGSGRKGVSSGLSTMVRKRTTTTAGKNEKHKWWRELSGQSKDPR